jgi:hypothetical protein
MILGGKLYLKTARCMRMFVSTDIGRPRHDPTLRVAESIEGLPIAAYTAINKETILWSYDNSCEQIHQWIAWAVTWAPCCYAVPDSHW